MPGIYNRNICGSLISTEEFENVIKGKRKEMLGTKEKTFFKSIEDRGEH